jgi:hypothetical protein
MACRPGRWAPPSLPWIRRRTDAFNGAVRDWICGRHSLAPSSPESHHNSKQASPDTTHVATFNTNRIWL